MTFSMRRHLLGYSLIGRNIDPHKPHLDLQHAEIPSCHLPDWRIWLVFEFRITSGIFHLSLHIMIHTHSPCLGPKCQQSPSRLVHFLFDIVLFAQEYSVAKGVATGSVVLFLFKYPPSHSLCLFSILRVKRMFLPPWITASMLFRPYQLLTHKSSWPSRAGQRLTLQQLILYAQCKMTLSPVFHYWLWSRAPVRVRLELCKRCSL